MRTAAVDAAIRRSTKLSRTIPFVGVGRIELLRDVLNALNDAAEDGVGDPDCAADMPRATAEKRLFADLSTDT